MQDALLKIGLLSAIFASVFLLSQVVLGGAWRRRAESGAINRRLRMIREGSTREEVVARLRKNAPRQFENLPPLLAGRLQAIQRMLMASAIPLAPAQVLWRWQACSSRCA